MARKKRPHVATPDEVTITRDGDFAIITYADEAIETTQYQVGAERLARMTDEDILAVWNAGLATAFDENVRSRRDMSGLLDERRTLTGVVESFPNTPNEPFLRVSGRTYTAVELAYLLGGHVGARISITVISDDGTE